MKSEDAKLNISEIFYSIQGEGSLAGAPSFFIRTCGCPLRCKFCDTPYSLNAKTGKTVQIEEIVKEIKRHSASHVVITGGEPMVCSAIEPLCEVIKPLGCHITIETSGIKFIDGLSCDLMSVSPKLSNAYSAAGDRDKFLKIDQLQKLLDNYDYQLKFVIDKKADMNEVEQLLKNLKNIDRSKVLLMPQSKDLAEYINKSPLVADICREYGLRFSPRLQFVCKDF